MTTPPSSTWPPKDGLTTVNVPRKDAILTVSASTRISSPAASVFSALLHVAEYEHWNSFCPRVTFPPEAGKTDVLQNGAVFTLHVIMDAAKPDKDTPTQLKVSDISTPSQPSDYISHDVREHEATYTLDLQNVYRIAWKCEGGFVSRGLKTERFHEVIVMGDQECEVRTWENQGGVLAHTVKWMYKQTLKEKFALWCKDLKMHCEQQAGQGNATSEEVR